MAFGGVEEVSKRPFHEFRQPNAMAQSRLGAERQEVANSLQILFEFLGSDQ